MAAAPVFYYDLGDPESYLAAERVTAELPGLAEWQPVPAGAGFAVVAAPDPEAYAERVAQLGLQPLRWPARWPPRAPTAMLAAAYAKQIGRVVGFSLAAFRQAFAGGRDLDDEDTVLIAAAACEMHPAAVRRALALRSVADALAAGGARAAASGVRELPAVTVGARVFTGPEAIQTAARALAEPRSPAQ